MSLDWGPATAYPSPDHREFFSDLLCCKIFNLYNCDSLFYGGVPQTLPIGLLVEAGWKRKCEWVTCRKWVVCAFRSLPLSPTH